MRRCSLLLLASVSITFTAATHGQIPTILKKPAPIGPTYEKDIRPLVVAQCVGCHNRTTMANASLSGGLALDSYETIRKGVTLEGKPARAIMLPGKPDESEFIKRLETTDTSRR